MSESRAHLRGVQALLAYVHDALQHRNDFVYLSDTPDSESEWKPPVVGGFRPDLHVHSWKTDELWIGESKTVRDLETERSSSQIRAFLKQVSANGGGRFVLSVPFASECTGRALIDRLGFAGLLLAERAVVISHELAMPSHPTGVRT